VTVRNLRDDADQALRRSWGTSIREHRKLREWTIDHLRDEMGGAVTSQAIGQWERGETAPRPHHQLLLAQAFKVPHRSLFVINDDVIWATAA
jgi:transcriptional regulator with XRE-family HTH domain